jgi:hypothetical protein
MISPQTEAITTFVLIMAYLLTDSPLIIGLIFISVLWSFGSEAGGNPLVALPKMVLGRSHATRLRDMLIAQAIGMGSALILYVILVKLKVIRKHPLDKLL